MKQLRLFIADYLLSWALALAGDYWSTPAMRHFHTFAEQMRLDALSDLTEEESRDV
jgi:hypothetical protein